MIINLIIAYIYINESFQNISMAPSDIYKDILDINKKVDKVEKDVNLFLNKVENEAGKQLNKKYTWMNNYYKAIVDPNSNARKRLSYKYGKDTADKISNASKNDLNKFNSIHKFKFMDAMSKGLTYNLADSQPSNIPPKDSTDGLLNNLGIDSNIIPATNTSKQGRDRRPRYLDPDSPKRSHLKKSSSKGSSKKGRTRIKNTSKKGRYEDDEITQNVIEDDEDDTLFVAAYS